MTPWNQKLTSQIVYSGNYEQGSVIDRFNGWSDRIMNVNIDYSEQELSLWCVGVTAIVRVILKDGSYHENIGFAEAKNISRGVAIREAKTVLFQRHVFIRRKLSCKLGNNHSVYLVSILLLSVILRQTHRNPQFPYSHIETKHPLQLPILNLQRQQKREKMH